MKLSTKLRVDSSQQLYVDRNYELTVRSNYALTKLCVDGRPDRRLQPRHDPDPPWRKTVRVQS